MKILNFKKILLGGLILIFVGMIGAYGVYSHYSKGLPDFKTLKEYAPPQMSKVYDRNGIQLGRFFKIRRTLIAQEKIAPVMIQALLSAEDADFYQHKGLDYWGMLRAIYNSVRAGRLKGSGSTLTQQTIKNILLSQEKTLRRKIREIILTRRIESNFSKDEILNMYLNTIYFGHGRYGIEEASLFYFGKSASQLQVHEAATLAGLIQSPERHSPRKHPDSALYRRGYVLREMLQNGYLTQEEHDQWSKKELDLAPYPQETKSEAGWWVNYIASTLKSSSSILPSLSQSHPHLKTEKQRLKEGGLKLNTTLDWTLQNYAHQALQEGLKKVDQRQKLDRPRFHFSTQEFKKWKTKRQKQLNQKPPPLNRPILAYVDRIVEGQVRVDLGVGKAYLHTEGLKRLSVPPKVGDVFKVILSFDGPRHPKVMRADLHLPQAAFIALDPHSREILAMVGGWSFKESSFNRATQSRRQPGSSFKPFVYGAALESRRFTLATPLIDSPETWPLGEGKKWTPKNYNGKYSGSRLLRIALAKSINSIAVRLADSVGLKHVQDFAQRVGIKSPLVDNLTLALGSSGVSLLELVNAYATFVGDGAYQKPYLFLNIEDAHGPLDWTPPDRPQRVLESDVAWLICNLLRSVVTEGSGSRLRGFSGEVIGKTGTSNQAKDTWFIGALPNLVFGVWVGYDLPQSLGKKEAGGRTAAPIILSFLDRSKWTSPSWPKPPKDQIIQSLIDPKTGLKAREDTLKPRTEYFLKSTEPKQYTPRSTESNHHSSFFGLKSENPSNRTDDSLSDSKGDEGDLKKQIKVDDLF